MAFDAGAIESSLTIDTSRFDRALADAEAKVKAFESGKHEVKLSAVFDASSLSLARRQFAQLDNQISKDAMSRLRSSPQGSVLGALNALFSPHPVTGAPSAQQAATQGLLGKMISAPGGGGPASGGGGSTVRTVLNQAAAAASPQPRIPAGQPGGGQFTTTDQVKQALVGKAPGDVTTTDTIKQVVSGNAPGDITTTDTVKERLDPDAAAKTEADSKASGDRSGTGWFASFTGHLRNLLPGSATGPAEKSAGDSGDRSGGNWFTAFTGHIQNLLPKSATDDVVKKAGQAGKDGGNALDKGLLGGIGPGIAGINTKISAIAGGIAVALGALPALAGIIGTGLGVTLIGGMVAQVVKDSPKLIASFKSLGAQATTMFKEATAPLVPAISAVLNQVPALIRSIEPQLAGIATAVAPQLQQVFTGLVPLIQGLIGVMQAAAPAFGPFIGALESLVSNILPGISTVIKATIPFVSQFAGILGDLGRGLGGLFAQAAPAIGAGMQILGGLLGLVDDLLPAVMKIADIFATALAPVFVTFTGVVRTLVPPLVQLGSIIASFAGAVIGDLAAAFSAVARLIAALTPSLTILTTTLGGVFTVMENAGVFAVLGNALEGLVVPLANVVNALVTGLAPALPAIIGAAGQLVTVLAGGLAAAIGAVLTALTPVVAFLAQAVTAVTGFLQSTGLLLPVMAGLGLAFGPVASGLKAMAAGIAAFAGSGFVAGIAGIVTGIRDFTAAAAGATAAEKAMVAGELLMESISPLGWAVIGVATVAALVIGLQHLQDGIGGTVTALAKQDNAVGYNIDGYQKLAAQTAALGDQQAKAAESIGTSAAKGAGVVRQVVAGNAAAYSAVSAQTAELAANMDARLTALSGSFGVSQTQIEKWATAAGISAQKFGGAGESVGLLTKQIGAFVDKNAEAITAAASLGTNIAIFGGDVYSATTQLDAFNQIWNTLVGNLLTKQMAITQGQQSFDNLKTSITQSGTASTTSKQAFQDYIQQIQSSLDALEKGGASVSDLNGYLQTQIDHLSSLHNLSPGEQQDLANLKTFQDDLANSTHGLTDAQQTLIGQFENNLIPDLNAMHANTPAVTTDISNLANSIIQTGNNSAATAADRAKLIADLADVGVKGQASTTFVDGLQTSIDNLKGKVVTVGVTATAQGTLNAISHLAGQNPSTSILTLSSAANGMLVSGGVPGKDSVLAMLMPGEVVVPTAMVQGGAVDHLKGSIPGFAAGGMVNLDSPGSWAASNEGTWGTAVASMWAQAVKSAFDAAMAAAAAAVPNVAAAAGAAGGTIATMMKNMAAARGWTGAEWNALYALEMAEAGFCLTLDHMILTKRGWLKHDEVVPGDETVGYNPETGKTEWTRVTAVHHYADQPVVTYGNKFWQATFTPGHRWLTETRLQRRSLTSLAVCPLCGFTGKNPKLGIRNHMARSHGWAKTKPRSEEIWQEPTLTPWNEFTGDERIILSRPADLGPGLPITDREAALLGWIAGDGCVVENRPVQRKAPPVPPVNWQERTEDAPFGLRRDGTPRKGNSGRPYKDPGRKTISGTSGLTVTIAQSKTKHFAAIEDALADVPGVSRYTQDNRGRRHATGFGVATLVGHTWRLPAAYAHDLIARAGHPKRDVFEQVTRMSASQRHAWLEAMIAAEGTVHVPVPGKPKDGRKTVIYQNDGPIADAIELAVYLEGYRPGRNRLGKYREVAIRPTVPNVGGPGRLSFSEDGGTADVWCVTTELGSWTARNESGMFLTGNSMTATNPSSGAYGLAQFINGPSEYAQYGGDSTTATGQITGMLSYIAQRYGDPIAAEAHESSFHWYDRGGYLQPGYTMAYNSTGRPEMVTPSGAGGASFDDVIARLDKLIRATEQVPAGVGAHVGGALNGAAHDASFRSRYPRG